MKGIKNMKSTELLELIQRHGLEKSLAYKVKDGDMKDKCVVQFKDGRWMDTLHSERRYQSEEDIIDWLRFALTCGNHITVFDCGCAHCLTPHRIAWMNDYANATGIYISHGFWPLCLVRELDKLEKEMASRGAQVSA
jgi:hypothetical protein